MHIAYHTSGAQAPAEVQARAARNLQLLQAIETTLDVLDSDTALMGALVKAFEEFASLLKQSAGSTEIDPSGATCLALSQAGEACVRIYNRAERRHKAACSDAQLSPDDGVADAYISYLSSVKDVHSSIEDTRDWIATHDAILQKPASKAFSSVDELFNSIGINEA